MRLLFFSDLRLAPDNGADIGGYTADIPRTLVRLGALARELKVDAVCGAGNLYLPGTSSRVVGVIRREWEKLDQIPVFLTPGSLDWWHPDSLYRELMGGNVHVFTTPLLSATPLSPRVTLWGAAHTTPRRENFFDSFVRDPGPGIHLALFHGCADTDFAEDSDDGLMTTPPTASFDTAQVHRLGFSHALVGQSPTPRQTNTHTSPGWASTGPADSPPGAVLVEVASDGAVNGRWYDLAAATDHSIVDSWVNGPGSSTFPPWAAEILTGGDPADGSPADHRAAWSAFERDVTDNLAPPHRGRVLQSARIALRDWPDERQA